MADGTAEEEIDVTIPPSGEGCLECEQSGGWWVHLRRCAACGHIGCCDTSPGQHSTAHYTETGHALIRSFEPGEAWYFDFGTQEMFASGPDLAPPESRPESQSVPGPADRVPANWRELIH
ncbi:UBP-type zinc finger domain-containing protein [Microbacterium istanbulense]|uniref:UBP-type zinc finger domain-containing protein n=1 Tax=Microbacterium istanbulense TaxID=3122049 RepID=A0ABU8LIM1_9MICO